MRTTLFLVSLLAAAQGTLAADLPPCVQKCEDENPTISWCNGDETGKAKDDCECKSWEMDPRIPNCLKQRCSAEDQNLWAQLIPEECRSDVMPNADASPPKSTASGTQVSGNAMSAPSPTTGTTTQGSGQQGSAAKAGPTSTSKGAASQQTPVAIAGAILAAFLV